MRGKKGERLTRLTDAKDRSTVLPSRCVQLEHLAWRGATHYTPMGEEEIRAWIEQESRATDQKGADYLICRVPVWLDGWEEQEQEFYDRWIRRVFEVNAVATPPSPKRSMVAGSGTTGPPPPCEGPTGTILPSLSKLRPPL